MIPLVATVFAASVLGSLHCAGMCGAFALFAVGTPGARVTSPAALHAAYNIGRLVVYLILGLIAGAAGATLELGAGLVGVQHAAAVAAGAMMVLFGVVTLLRVVGARVPGPPVPKALQELAIRGHRAASGRSPVVRALCTGLFTTLLPCGWLYAFVATAAGTANPWTGAAVMAAFWLGTLPMLVAVSAAARRISGPFASRLPAVMALLLVVVGIVTVATRAGLIDRTGAMLAEMESRAIAASEDPMSARTLSEDLPCCRDHAPGANH